MEKLITVSAQQMQQLDRYNIETVGIPNEVLMERAALGVTEIAILFLNKGIRAVKKLSKEGKLFKNIYRKKCLAGKKILILCGKGNNGGDGLAVARQLQQLGAEVLVYLSFSEEEYKSTARLQLEIVKKIGLKIFVETRHAVSLQLNKFDLIIDAVFGTGFSGNVKEPQAKLFKAINAIKKPVISIDIPSGLNSTTGEIGNIAIKALITVTFQYLKTGLLQNQGKKYSGVVVVWEIGLIS